MSNDRSILYALADNLIGFDDDYDTLLERGSRAVRDDPVGVASMLGESVLEGIRDFGGRFIRNPAGAVVDTANELGLDYVESGKRLSGGIGAYTDQGMSIEEARDAQLMDALTLSELAGGGIFANQLRRAARPRVDVDGSGPADPGRRDFLKKSAATAGIATVAPDVFKEVMDAVPTAARRVVGANPLGAAVSQLEKLRKQVDELTEVAAGRGEMAVGNREDYRREAFAKFDEIADTRSAALDALDADTLANASDADLDTFVREFYDYNLSGYDSVNSSDFEHPAYDALVIEMQKRGLHKQKDRKGLDKYPYARAMVEDYGVKTRKEGEFPRPADIDEESANKRIADAFSHAAQLRDAKLNAVRDNLPVTRVADYDNAVRDVKVAMERLEGIQNRFKDPEVNPFDLTKEKMAAVDEAVPLLANNRGGVSLTNARTEAMITPSMENPGKFRISYIDRKSGEPMGDTENFETMEAAIRDAMGQGYLTLGRFEPQNFANGGGVGSLSHEARDMFRGPRGIESLSRFAKGGGVGSRKYTGFDDDREALEALANVEYAADMQKHLQDPLSQLGFDPDIAVVDRNPQGMYPTDSYELRGDVLTIDPGYGMYIPEIQAHEYRHRGAHKVLDLYRSDPERFTADFGEAAANTAKNLIRGDDYLYGETLAEFYEQPSKFNYPTVYYSETGDVVHPNRLEEYMAANPDVALKKVNLSHDGHLTHLQDFPETTDFREYKESGIVNTPELRQMFEGAEGFQKAAKLLLEHNPVRGYANGGEVIASKQASAEDLANLATKIREDYGFDPVALALEIGIDPELALRLVHQESRGKQSAGSEKGARGLTQLMPGTAEEMGVDINDPKDNFIGGMKYLKKMTDRFGLELGLAAYNAGPGNVAKYGGVPPFKETQDYLKIILEPFQGASVQPLIETGAENYLMSQPVAVAGEYSPRPRLRPENFNVPMINPISAPSLTPQVEEALDAKVQEALLRPKRVSMVEKYGLPGEIREGIGSLSETARNMYS